MIKICPICKIEKSKNDFYKNRGRRDGLGYRCKSCENQYLAKYKNRKPIYSKNYYKKNRDKVLTMSRKNTQDIRELAFEIVANGKKIKCRKHGTWKCCKNSNDRDFLSLDHINGNGFEHRISTGDGSSRRLYYWVINNPEQAKKELQIICMNAQAKKTRLNNEHNGHQSTKEKWHDDNIGQKKPLGGKFIHSRKDLETKKEL